MKKLSRFILGGTTFVLVVVITTLVVIAPIYLFQLSFGGAGVLLGLLVDTFIIGGILCVANGEG